jgi:hypothetical protein
MRGHPLIVSYFTPDAAYERHARILEASVKRLGLESRIEPRPSRGSWIENCAQKALFIRQIRAEEGRPVLWVDADAVVRRPVIALIGSDADLSTTKRGGWSFAGGHIYFGDGDGATTLLDKWCAYSVEYPFVFDQVLLGYAWWDCALTSAPPTVEWMDDGIITILSSHPLKRLYQRMTTRAAIIHKQESRSSKDSMPRPDRRVFRTRDVPGWWREAAKIEQPFHLNDDQRSELGLA